MSLTAPASTSPLEKYHPTCVELIPSMQIRKDVVVCDAFQSLTTDLRGMNAPEDEDEYHELMEWIDEVSLGSEEAFEGKVRSDLGATAPTATIRGLSFQGLLCPEKVFQVLISIM